MLFHEEIVEEPFEESGGINSFPKTMKWISLLGSYFVCFFVFLDLKIFEKLGEIDHFKMLSGIFKTSIFYNNWGL